MMLLPPQPTVSILLLTFTALQAAIHIAGRAAAPCTSVFILMAPAVAERPRHTCHNYPICSGLQAQIPVEGTNKRERQRFCKRCSSADTRCAHPQCEAPVAPPFRRPKTQVTPTFCTPHYSDPYHNTTREWNLCRNARVGCRLLATNKSSGPCFPCSQGSLPCRFAVLGCPSHVRQRSKMHQDRFRNASTITTITLAPTTLVANSPAHRQAAGRNGAMQPTVFASHANPDVDRAQCASRAEEFPELPICAFTVAEPAQPPALPQPLQRSLRRRLRLHPRDVALRSAGRQRCKRAHLERALNAPCASSGSFLALRPPAASASLDNTASIASSANRQPCSTSAARPRVRT